MNQLVEQSDISACHRLALQFDITSIELDSLCSFIQEMIDHHLSHDLQVDVFAVKMVRAIKVAIDLKFDRKEISSESFPDLTDVSLPVPNNFKANLVRGMFLTFIEHPVGFPGFFDIVAGIAGAGMGLGKISLPEIKGKVSLAELRKHFPEPKALRKRQLMFLKTFFTPATLKLYPNIRIATYSILTGCALMPYYYAAFKISCPAETVDENELLEKSLQFVKERFDGRSDRMQKFMKQNLFRVLFEELFTHESTVFSIFAI